MKKLLSIVLCLTMLFTTLAFTNYDVNAKTVKLKRGIYYNSKKKIYMQVGSRWDEKNECTISIEAKDRPGHLDQYLMKYKKKKLVNKLFKNSRTYIKIKSKKKFVWKGNKKDETSFLNGTFKYKRKGNL